MPSPVVIKKRIEGLIEREYLARTADDRYDRLLVCLVRLTGINLLIYITGKFIPTWLK